MKEIYIHNRAINSRLWFHRHRTRTGTVLVGIAAPASASSFPSSASAASPSSRSSQGELEVVAGAHQWLEGDQPLEVVEGLEGQGKEGLDLQQLILH